MTGWKRQLQHEVQRFLNISVRRLGLQVSRRGDGWELIEPEQLQRFLRYFAVDCVFDVGANAGQYGQRLREIGFTGRIISFEPNPETAARLRAVAAGDASWTVKELALDSVSRPLTFNIMKSDQFSSLHQPDHSGTAAFKNMNAVARTVSLQTRTIKDLFPELQGEFGFRRPYLKMDTQGHDVDVVRGADTYMAQFVGMQSELAITKLYQSAPDLHEALDYYQHLGFKLSSLVPNNAGHFPDLNEVDCIMYNTQLVSLQS